MIDRYSLLADDINTRRLFVCVFVCLIVVNMGHTSPRNHQNTFSTETLEGLEQLWVFGYGSIVWKQGFEFTQSKLGYISGYERRFYQGSISHRGTPDKPGRVATLIESKLAQTWGAAYELRGDQIAPALDHLGLRECVLGGYSVMMLPFTICDGNDANNCDNNNQDSEMRKCWKEGEVDSAKDCNTSRYCEMRKRWSEGESDGAKDCDCDCDMSDCDSNCHTNNGHFANLTADCECQMSDCDSPCEGHRGTIPVLLFTATPENNLYLGEASLPDIAEQVVSAEGFAGHDVEYVLRIANFIRDNCPNVQDPHLFGLESHIRRILKEKEIDVESLMNLGLKRQEVLQTRVSISEPNNVTEEEQTLKHKHENHVTSKNQTVPIQAY